MTSRPEVTRGSTAQPGARLAWLDWLRVLAIVGIFAAHVAQVFMPWADWFVTNDERSRLVGLTVLVIGPWLLPLLMLLSGFACWHSLERRSNRAFIRERAVRVLIPFAIGMLVLIPPQLFVERRLQGQFEGSFVAFYPRFFTEGLYPDGNFALRHLWFLAHLFVYSLLALPLFRYWRGTNGQHQLDRLGRMLGGRAGWLWLALPLVLERHITWFALTSANLHLDDWTSQTTLFAGFVYGYLLAGSPRLLQMIDARWPDALQVALAFTAVLAAFAWNGYIPDRLPPSSTAAELAFWSLYTVGAWAWTVAAIGLARGHFRRDTRLLAYARGSAYSWYLLHQTVIVVLAAWIVTWPTGVFVKLTGLTLIAAVATAIGAALLNRVMPGRQRQ